MFLILFAGVALSSLPYCSVWRDILPWDWVGGVSSLSEVFSVHVTGVAGELRWDVVPVFHARRSCLGAQVGVDPFPHLGFS